jgi:hypothetical protein
MGPEADKRKRPRADMDNARFLDQSRATEPSADRGSNIFNALWCRTLGQRLVNIPFGGNRMALLIVPLSSAELTCSNFNQPADKKLWTV